jgi:hypothetical protein
MPRETVTIAVSELYPYESAAMLFAVLAYPEDKSDRGRFADALCNSLLRHFATDPAWADELQNTRPRHWMVDAETADMRCKHGMKIINEERLIAAKMASQTWAAAIPRPDLEKPARPTSRAMLTAVSIDLDERRGTVTDGYNKGNLVDRHWSTSKPVLHLCLGMHRVIHETATDQRTCTIGDFYYNRELTRAVITSAAPVFKLAEQRFGIAPDEMVEVIAV